MDYLVDDPSTRVILLYIESIRHPEKFRAAALRAQSAGKPIVVYKVGKSESGIKAAVSHTGAVAGADKMYDALFRQVGIIRANRFTDFLDIPAALTSRRILKGRRVAILTSTGGAGTLIADSLGESGFETPAPDEKTAARLRALQPGDQAVLDRNPIDVTLAGLQPDLLRAAIRALLNSPTYDALILILGSSSLAMPDLMAGAVRECMQISDKPVIAYVSPHAPIAGALMTSLGVPAFSQPESCSIALSSMLRASQFTIPAAQAKTPDQPSIPSGIGFLPTHGSLNEHDAKKLFSAFGIAIVKEVVLDPLQPDLNGARKLGEKLVLKILSNEITHKTEVGGVALNVSCDDLVNRMTQMQSEVKTKSGEVIKHFLAQEMVSGGIELMLGMHTDPLGTAILVGMGGLTTELFQDHQMRLLEPGKSLSENSALEMLGELKIWPLLDGYRGRKKCDVNALVQAIVKFSELVAFMGERLVECEINPVFVFEQGKGIKAADGIVVLK